MTRKQRQKNKLRRAFDWDQTNTFREHIEALEEAYDHIYEDAGRLLKENKAMKKALSVVTKLKKAINGCQVRPRDPGGLQKARARAEALLEEALSHLTPEILSDLEIRTDGWRCWKLTEWHILTPEGQEWVYNELESCYNKLEDSWPASRMETAFPAMEKTDTEKGQEIIRVLLNHLKEKP